MNTVRPAAVAGYFYPREAKLLVDTVTGLLATAGPGSPPKAMVAPHAGYIYSGPIAASAYATLAPRIPRINRVVLLGPTHRVAVRGLATPGVDAFATPLGLVAVDEEAVQAIAGLPQVVESPAAHAMEHSLEVHLPFLQTLLGEFKLVPLAVGNADREEVAEVLDRLWGGEETLIVVSSDLSHYLPYDAAQRIDGATAQAILRLDASVSHEQACGATPLNGLLLIAQRKGLSAELLDLRNSGDTAGDRSRVVGYGAFTFSEPRDAAAA
jgi:MEMO1 family protein